MAPRDVVSTRELARICGVSESTIKRWADEGVIRCLKTPGGHRKFPLAEVLEFVQTHDLGVEETANLTERERIQLHVERLLRARKPDALQEALFEALREGDRLTALHLIRRAAETGYPLATLIDEVIAPALDRIGQHWEEGALGVHEEHRASQLVLDAIGELRARARDTLTPTRVALGACPTGESHAIGLKLLLTLLAHRGWRVIDLGADTPFEAIAAMSTLEHPRLVLLSVSQVAEPATFLAGCRKLRGLLPTDSRLAVGGHGLSKSLRAKLPADYLLDSAADLTLILPALE